MAGLPGKTVALGNPQSSIHQISQVQLADWMTEIEGLTGLSGFAFVRGSAAALSGLGADGNYALVVTTAAERGIYQRASGTWSKVADLPLILTESLAADQAEADRILAQAAAVSAGNDADAAAASATAAASSQSLADVARTQAQLAAVAAGATLYASVATGEAGTVNGDVFLVSTEPGVQVYENSAGTGLFLGWLGEVLLDDVSALVAWGPAPADGTIVRTRKEGFSYESDSSLAASELSGSTVKLKLLRNASEQIPARAANADDSESLQRAINSGQNVVVLPIGTTNIATQIDIPEGVSLIGPNIGNATLNYTGTGTALKVAHSSGTDTRIYNTKLAGFMLLSSTGAIGLDILSLSEGWVENVTVAGFSGTGIALHSGISGGAVYNRFLGVKAQSCPVGWDLYRDSGISSYTNDNIFHACRANNCSTVGVRITGGNHNVWQSGQIEGCALGLLIEEPATATTQRNTIITSRFENNTADIEIGAGVSETILGPENWYVNGDRITDNGSRTQFIGAGPMAHFRSSGFQLPGGSFRYERTANGGSQVPNAVFSDTSTLNSPVTLQIQNVAASSDARAFRVKYGTDATGNFKFGVVPISGKIVDLSMTNGPVGTFTMTAGSPTTVVPNTAVGAASIIMLQPYDPDAAQMAGSAACPYISARTSGASFSVTTGDGSNANGTQIFAYWLVN